jgi:glycosyltransferase involved in cell wall biosynthesis
MASVVVIVAYPDDETIGAGAYLARMSENANCSTVFHTPRPRTLLHRVSQTQRRFCQPTSDTLPVIPNSVPVERFNLRIGKRDFVFSLGGICPEKGFHLALEAAAISRRPVLLAGEVSHYPAHEDYYHQEITQEIAPRLDRQRRFIGPIGFGRRRRLLTSARCLLAPSFAPERSSLVVMEALASGAPVISFPSGGLGETVEDGVTGFLVNDSCEMAEAIGAIGSLDPDVRREAARTRFSAERMIERYSDLYRRLIAGDAQELEESLISQCGAHFMTPGACLASSKLKRRVQNEQK